MPRSYEIPKKYKDIVGTKQIFSGGLFSGKKDLAESEYEVYDIRWGSAQVINWEEMCSTGKSSICHPTIEYLLGNRSMKRKQWTRGFPVYEIDINKLKGEKDHGE
ncbi:hypothetical protein [Sphingobacterium detergens]|uniref:hypothetical protein n=1 Tax=Sphingobacterium detergens TaxID=1145106 RepID=UPI003AAC1FC8